MLTMVTDTAIASGAIGVISLIAGLAMLVLCVIFMFWVARFLNEVPRQLKDIADILEEIAKK